jgi:hypothetical protein
LGDVEEGGAKVMMMMLMVLMMPMMPMMLR